MKGKEVKYQSKDGKTIDVYKTGAVIEYKRWIRNGDPYGTSFKETLTRPAWGWRVRRGENVLLVSDRPLYRYQATKMARYMAGEDASIEAL